MCEEPTLKPLSDVAAERGVLCGICQYGQNAFIDVADIVNSETFTVTYNELIYSCLKKVFEHEETVGVDITSIYSAGEELGLSNIMSRKEMLEHVNALFNFPIKEENVRKFAAKIRKLQITRNLREKLKDTSDHLLEVTGNESITEIIGQVEGSIIEFGNHVSDDNSGPDQFSDGLVDYIKYLEENPVDQVGIDTGFPEFDKAIGGGLRPGINMICARPAHGKSTIGLNMGFHIANTHNIPVLHIDTEMEPSIHKNRTLALASNSFIYDIETGKFTQNPEVYKKIKDAARSIEKRSVPYFSEHLVGRPFEEHLAIIRRWIIQNVDIHDNSNLNRGVVVYDYFHMKDSSNVNNNVAEFQQLGFMLSALDALSVQYKIPFLVLSQVNRDGISKETTDIASGSDRIVWICSNFTILKEKSDEEIKQDGVENGNRKLVPLKTRHGSGVSFGDYINCYMYGAKAQIKEGKTKKQLMDENPERNDSV